MTTPHADPESVNDRLAEFLVGRRDEIMRAWLARVEVDPAIKTRTLSAAELKDHLPRLVDDIAASLRVYEGPTHSERFAKDAAKHGSERWQQGYEVTELLREIMHLRAIFVYHLHVFEELHPEFGTAARVFADSTIHAFLDEIGIESTEQFLRSDRQARAAASGILP